MIPVIKLHKQTSYIHTVYSETFGGIFCGAYSVSYIGKTFMNIKKLSTFIIAISRLADSFLVRHEPLCKFQATCSLTLAHYSF